MTASAVMARERSRPALSPKHARAHSALTSHGWPSDCAHTVSSAPAVNACPVSSVCWAIRARASASVKSPMRNDSARMLNALPPVTTARSVVEWMR